MSLASIAARALAFGLRPPQGRRFRTFDQLSRTTALIKRLGINVVLDVGANRGLYAKRIREAGYSGHLFSFEPITPDCQLIEGLATRDPKWKTLNVALGSENGTKTFNIMRLGGHTVLSSFLSMKDIPATEQVSVPIRKIDDVVPALIRDIENPRIFLKIDTQGYDAEVIKGSVNVLPLVLGLQSEISVIPIYDGMHSYTESLANYHQLGFELVDLFVVNRTANGAVLEYDCLMQRVSWANDGPRDQKAQGAAPDGIKACGNS